MQDITMYSDDELSMHVFNVECLYNERHNLNVLLGIVQDNFVYTQEQLEVLIQDIADDLEEQ